MTRLALALACAGVLLLLGERPSAEVPLDATTPVVEIEWRGQANMGQDEFLALIGIQVGDTVQRHAVRRSLERLYLKGFFSQIRIESVPVREGLKLTYYTTPAAFVQRIHIRGNTAVRDQSILARLRPQVEERFSEHRLTVSLDVVRHFYVEQGFPQATVTGRSQFSDDRTRVTIFLDIQEGPPLLVDAIRFEGVTAFGVDELLAQFKVGPGQPLNAERLSDDLERLQRRYQRAGYLTIRLEGPRIEPNWERHTAVVTLAISEGPKIVLSFVGNRHLSQKILQEAVLINVFNGYGDDVLVASRHEMVERYREQGYHFATVRHQVQVDTGGGAVLIHFVIDEGPQVTVESLRITGHHALLEPDLRAQFLTQARGVWGMFSRGLFIAQQLARDLEAVQFLYRRRGFLKAQVQQDLTFSKDRAKVAMQVVIDEGPRTSVEAVTIVGAEAISSVELQSQLRLQSGDPFDEGRLQEDMAHLSGLYEQRGYRDVRLTVERRFSDDERLVHLTYRIDEGQPRIVGDIIVQGNFRTQVEVITRELTFESGDPLSWKTLLDSRRKLSQLSLFARLAMNPRFEGMADEDDVIIQVVERNPTSLNFGAGYGSEDKLRGFVEFAHQNLDGMHRQFRARAQASFREQKYLVNVREPRLFGTLLSTTAGLSLAEEQHASFDVRRTSTQGAFDFPLGAHARAFLTYSFDIERLFDVKRDAITSEVDRGRLNIASILGSIQRNNRDTIIDAHRGTLQRLSFEVADLVLGSEVSFFKLTGTAQWCIPLVWDTVGVITLQGGMAEAFATTGEVPMSRRFFLGGSDTVRGYDFEKLGPKGSDGSPTGGNVFVLANLEWRVPFYKGLDVVFFSDIGNVYRAIDDLSPIEVKGALGLGLRYSTPIGPLRLDYGRKIAPERQEASGRFHFSIGHAF